MTATHYPKKITSTLQRIVAPKIQLIRNNSNLKGTAYFELLPGRFADQHWNESSVFLAEEIFGLIERPFIVSISDYDHYSFTDVSSCQWHNILARLKELQEAISAARSLEDVQDRFCGVWDHTKAAFAAEFEKNKAALIQPIDDIIEWVLKTLKHHSTIAVLGM